MKFFFIIITFLVPPLWSQVKVAELPEEGHGTGRVPAADPKFADWMFSQKKK